MIGWLAIGTFFVLLIALIVMTQIHITVHYHHHQDNDSLTIRVRAWRFPVYTYKVPQIAIDEESASFVFEREKKVTGTGEKKSGKKVTKEDILARMRMMRHFLKNIEGLHKIIKRFFHRVTVRRLQWHTKLGLGDAARTGMAAGAVWAAKGNIVGLLGHYMNLLETPEMSVDPVFHGDHSETDLSCIFSFRLGHAMKASLQIVKFWKGRQPAWQKEKDKSRDIQSRT